MSDRDWIDKLPEDMRAGWLEWPGETVGVQGPIYTRQVKQGAKVIGEVLYYPQGCNVFARIGDRTVDKLRAKDEERAMIAIKRWIMMLRIWDTPLPPSARSWVRAEQEDENQKKEGNKLIDGLRLRGAGLFDRFDRMVEEVQKRKGKK